ncbi:uncharacterized protein BJ171DRAFT_515047 [Polychytrium aggregatum]|uniref:uncharacterized protein n=1 Tax=Polychytrium aggregatum TaxID=110093 RepID=UPI0022FE4D3F|nr:uncharacterized protein BJ171DRAFT_515047 [Polychytrium aggregatum]KAI9202156.1 hypothetical protein BJ171DRAFT_515047 [Polychytrium aggregatum]
MYSARITWNCSSGMLAGLLCTFHSCSGAEAPSLSLMPVVPPGGSHPRASAVCSILGKTSAILATRRSMSENPTSFDGILETGSRQASRVGAVGKTEPMAAFPVA